MKVEWLIEDIDVKTVVEFVKSQINNPFVKKRIEKNVNGPIPNFNREVFWKTMVSCLLTTQQRSGPDSTVTDFICTKPFPLNFRANKKQVKLAKFIEDTITKFGGLRRAKTIGDEVEVNLGRLEGGVWREIENFARVLLNNRKRKPQVSDAVTERKAAHFVIENLKGFGPKQSRNLWQALGLTRFEIPIDSRITKWLNNHNFPVRLSASGLSDSDYYNFIMDGIQKLCRASNTYPCILDAAIFASFDKEWSEDKLVW